MVEDPLMDILSKSIAEPGRDPGGGGSSIGSGAPPATNTGAAAGVAGFAIGWVMGTGMFTTLACASEATTCIAGGAGANGAGYGWRRQRVWRRGNP